MKVTLIPQLYEHLFFIGVEPGQGGRPMFDLLYLTSLRGCVTNKDDSKSKRQSTRDTETAGETALDNVSESDVASSLGELTQKAGLLEWNNHMTWCNRTLKKEVVELEKIQEHADNGKLVPPLLC